MSGCDTLEALLPAPLRVALLKLAQDGRLGLIQPRRLVREVPKGVPCDTVRDVPRPIGGILRQSVTQGGDTQRGWYALVLLRDRSKQQAYTFILQHDSPYSQSPVSRASGKRRREHHAPKTRTKTRTRTETKTKTEERNTYPNGPRTYGWGGGLSAVGLTEACETKQRESVNIRHLSMSSKIGRHSLINSLSPTALTRASISPSQPVGRRGGSQNNVHAPTSRVNGTSNE